jgi:nitrogen regulatory protein P-II 1
VKKIEAVIKPHKLDDVKCALDAIGVHGLTASEVEGFGQQKGQAEIFLGSETRTIEFLPKVKIEVVVADDDADKVEAAIVEAAHTGHIGDGKLFVSECVSAVRIRTGEHGPEAL